jgi:predicted lipoprotein with Yx(FWY)xxD motif
MAKGDFTLESKHADVQLTRGKDFSLWFFDQPQKGKCLCMEFCWENWPAGYIWTTANWKAKRTIAKAKNELGFEEVEHKF